MVNDFFYVGGQLNVENLAGNQVREARKHCKTQRCPNAVFDFSLLTLPLPR